MWIFLNICYITYTLIHDLKCNVHGGIVYKTLVICSRTHCEGKVVFAINPGLYFQSQHNLFVLAPYNRPRKLKQPFNTYLLRRRILTLDECLHLISLATFVQVVLVSTFRLCLIIERNMCTTCCSWIHTRVGKRFIKLIFKNSQLTILTYFNHLSRHYFCEIPISHNILRIFWYYYIFYFIYICNTILQHLIIGATLWSSYRLTFCIYLDFTSSLLYNITFSIYLSFT